MSEVAVRPWPTRRVQGAASRMADAAAMMCDLSTGPAEGKMWRVLNCSGTGFLSTTAMNTNVPFSGFFVVARNTPFETLAEGSSVTGSPAGVNLSKRGAPIPMFCASPLIPAQGSYALAMSMQSSLPVYVLPGETIRMVVASLPGTATPGPGAGSFCAFTALVEEIDANAVN